MEEPTEVQRRVAAALGVDVVNDTSTVAAARIRDVVAEAIGERFATRPATTKQIEYGIRLGLDLRSDSIRVASAKIGDELSRRNFEAIARLDLRPGDHVLKHDVFELRGESHELVREFVVSSIQANARVFFKGGNGQGAWPTQLEKLDGGHGG